jgi:hypothetical protein
MKTPLVSINLNAALDQLALICRGASDLGLDLLDAIRVQPETLTSQLDQAANSELLLETRQALETAILAAKPNEDTNSEPWLNAALVTATDEAFPEALREIPVTVSILLGSIMEVAAEHGFDPTESSVMKRCLAVMGVAGPFVEDSGSDMVSLVARIDLTGLTAHGVILRVSPRLSGALAMKLGAQALPKSGHAIITATGYAFTSYYQAMARVLFGLMVLATQTGQSIEALGERLFQRMGKDSLAALC